MSQEEPKENDLEQELEALYRKVASPDHTEGTSLPEPPPAAEFMESESLDTGERTDTHPADENKKKRAPFRLSHSVAGAVFSILVLALIAVFFWPTMYHYDALNLEGKGYPLRINRLTGDSSYFDGNDWSRPPLPAPVRKTVPENPAVQSAAAVPPDANQAKAGTAVSSPVPPPIKTQAETAYAVQIRAFPESEKKEALAFAENVKKKLPDARMETVQIPGRGIWHRILIGNYSGREEADGDMKKRKLPDLYPGSFVQKKTAGQLP
jgi:hypothetical protein